MAKKLLNLKLIYKGKELDTTRQNRDFTSKFYIGSDKHLFWQILDNSFPKKFLLVEKKGQTYVLNIHKSMHVTVQKDKKTLNEKELKRKRILKNNQLILTRKLSGKITFLNKWEIKFSFKEPYVVPVNKEHLRIHAKYAKRPKLPKEQRFTRIFILVALIITIIGLNIFERTYEPPAEIDFASRLRNIESMATRIEPQMDEPEEEAEGETGTTTAVPGSEEEAKEVTEKAAQMGAKEIESKFGIDVSDQAEAGGDYEKEILEVTTIDPMYAAQGEGAGSGTGGIGGVPSDEELNSVLDVGGSGDILGEGAGGLSSDFGDLGNTGDLSSLTNLGSTKGFKELSEEELGEEKKQLKITKISSGKEFQKIKGKYAALQAIKEGDIKLEKTPVKKTELANINQQIDMYKPQINRIYTIETLQRELYGTIEFILIIDKSEGVVAVDFRVLDGSYFSPNFIQKAKETIMDWNIKVKDNIKYSFRMTFIEN